MAERHITRSASPRPATADEQARTVELTIASQSDCGDGVVLRCEPGSFDHGPIVPVLLGHENRPAAMAGRITHLRAEGGQVIGLAEFKDAPAAEAGWQLARSGCAVSVGASLYPDSLQRYSDTADIATRWRLREASLVPVGQDPLALTRSAQLSLIPETIMENNNNQAQIVTDDEPTLSRAEAKRQRDLVRLAADAGLPLSAADAWIERNLAFRDASREAIAAVRERAEGHLPAIGHPAAGGPDLIGPTLSRHLAEVSDNSIATPAKILEAQIDRAVRGLPLAQPLTETLKQAGYRGRTSEELVRNAFTGTRPESWLQRGFHSTSDAKELLIQAGDRRLQERHAEAPRGILELARMRVLSDFREVSVIDAGLVGGAVQLNEGAEIKYGSLQSEAGKYKATRYGLGLSFTFEALQSDDLGGIAAVIDEVSATILEAEAATLGELLHGDSTEGGICPDGETLFAAAHNNIPDSPATMSTQGLSAMIELLRRQTSVGGRQLWLSPGYVLTGPDLETTALSLLSDAWEATSPDDVNPWKSLRLIVDPTVEEGYFYLVASGNRKPFELGRVAGMPQMRQEEDFNTSGMRMKIESAHGAACIDHRVIVRNK